MKLLVIGDLHGRKPRIHFKEFDAIVFVGDVNSDEELGKHIKEWFKYLKTHDKISLDRFLVKKFGRRKLRLMEERALKAGRKIMEFFNGLGKPVFMIPGNWDDSYGKTNIKDPDENRYSYLRSFYDYWLGEKINPRLIKGLKNIIDCQYKTRKLKWFNIVGYGLVSAPEDLKARKVKIGKSSEDSVSKEQYKKLKRVVANIYAKLEKAYKKRDKKLPTIFLTHNVPYNTKLDIIRDKKSYAYKKHLGSSVARDFCKKNKPILCIGGHIHENYGKDRIGKTIVINSGFGSDANVLIDLSDGKVDKIEFYRK